MNGRGVAFLRSLRRKRQQQTETCPRKFVRQESNVQTGLLLAQTRLTQILIDLQVAVERASKRLDEAEVGTRAKRVTRWESLLALSIIARLKVINSQVQLRAKFRLGKVTCQCFLDFLKPSAKLSKLDCDPN